MLAILLVGCAPGEEAASGSPGPAGAAAVDEAGWDEYLQRAAVADKQDGWVARCLAYPDLPGNDWVPGAARARCPLLVDASPSIEELGAVLASEDGADLLDRRFAALLEAQASDPGRDESLFLAFNAFGSSDESRRLAAQWLSQKPRSPYARAAMGSHLVAAAGRSRGDRWIRDTPASNVQAMERLMRAAIRMLQSALDLEPRLGPACVDLMVAARLLGDRELRDSATGHCLSVAPLSWNVRFEQQQALDPRWGGSFAELEASVAELRPLAERNPALGGMLARAVGLRAYLAYLGRQAPIEDLAPEFERAARIAPDPIFIGEAGMAARAARDYRKALGYLSQALRLAPANTRFLRGRAEVRMKLEDYQGAVVDARQAMVAGGPTGHNYAVLGRSLSRLGRTAEAREAFHAAMQDPNQRKWAFMRWCETYILGEMQHDEALACSQGLAAEYPDEAEAQFMRSVVLYKAGRAEQASAAAARFARLVDERRPRERQMVSELARISSGE
ncbi:DUF4034 domain-containing protein [Luteimonas sp. RD2P54]|uniref:DUF4034 domain-containing protein n=1 Tax=Luteimonas endophytica TaxID=3042023 RepID=A0ABT6JAC6_9GAMM|nr:DUF4034 domain-containing protein [Luteimonas endophytica]MDH5823699.1 DUF4034 domain-containing protein [Luteimonas endophytica]